MTEILQDQILRLPDVEKATGLSGKTIRRKMDAGEFPKSVSLGARAVGWSAKKVNEWILSHTQPQAAL